jgi:hypothetical protein
MAIHVNAYLLSSQLIKEHPTSLPYPVFSIQNSVASVASCETVNGHK